MRIDAAGQGAREVVGERPDVLRNRHVVVVQDDQQVRGQRAGVIERLERHAGRHRTVADDGHDTALLPKLRGRDRHTERRTDGGARVTNTEGVVLAFRACRKGCESAVLLDRMQPVSTAGEDFVWIRLVADVPDQPVLRCLENVMQCDRQLDGSQAGREVPAPRADALNEEIPQLFGHGGQLGKRQPAQVRRRLDSAQQRVLIGRRSHLHQFTRTQLTRLTTKCASSVSIAARSPRGASAARA